ncbi:MAG: hypothetical protein U0169_05085 [Polyangiaceae bacterium]
MRTRAALVALCLAGSALPFGSSACSAPDPGEVDLHAALRTDGGRRPSSDGAASPDTGATVDTGTTVDSGGATPVDSGGTGVDSGGVDSGTPDVGVDAPVDTGPSAPTIASFMPNTATAGSADFNMSILGTNYVPGCAAMFGATALTTSYVSSTAVAAVVPSGVLTQAGNFPVSIRCGTVTASAATTFTVTAAQMQAPNVTSLAPTAVNRGTVVDLTVGGSNFGATSKVVIGTTVIPNSVVTSATQIRTGSIQFNVSGQFAVRVQTTFGNTTLTSAQSVVVTVL